MKKDLKEMKDSDLKNVSKITSRLISISSLFCILGIAGHINPRLALAYILIYMFVDCLFLLIGSIIKNILKKRLKK